MGGDMRKFVAMGIVFIFLVSLTAQSVRAEGVLTDFFDMIKKWFESSPFGNIFSMPVKRTERVRMTFYPQAFEFDVTEGVNVSSNETSILDFRGTISVDMPNNLMSSKSSESPIVINQIIGEITIEGLKINVLDIKGMKLELTSGNWTETADNGSITIRDFLGMGIVRKGSIELEGNVSKTDKF
jgi:hypothetical protein